MSGKYFHIKKSWQARNGTFPIRQRNALMSLPHAIPSVDFPVVQIVLYTSVKHKFPLM